MPKLEGQVFVSYSRKDGEFVERLIQDLQSRDVNVWRDTERITPGTANWEKAIRKAIEDSSAIVLVASPASLRSEYVQGELMVAKMYQRPIYPVWASGDSWIDCVPLEMAKLQYIDGRKENYLSGIDTLSGLLKVVLDTSKGVVTVHLPTYDTIESSVAQFGTISNMLNTIYMQYLYTWVPPQSYGVDWVVGNIESKRLILPWQWLEVHSQQEINHKFSTWYSAPLTNFDVLPDTKWGIWDIERFPVVGVATNSDDVKRRLDGSDALYQLTMLHSSNQLTVAKFENLIHQEYKHQIVLGLVGKMGQFATTVINQSHEAQASESKTSFVFVDS